MFLTLAVAILGSAANLPITGAAVGLGFVVLPLSYVFEDELRSAFGDSEFDESVDDSQSRRQSSHAPGTYFVR